MKEIVIPIKKHKLVEDGIENQIWYETNDGAKFTNKRQANDHEEVINFIEEFNKKYQLKKIDIESYSLAIFIKAFLDINPKDFKRKFGREFKCSDLKLGWNFIEEDSSGDYTYFTTHTPEQLLKWKREEIEKIESFQKENP